MSHEQQETTNAALSLVKEFFAAKERHDLDATMALFSEDALYIFPLPASGKQENWFRYKGKEAITKYQGQVLERFKQIRMLEPATSSLRTEAMSSWSQGAITSLRTELLIIMCTSLSSRFEMARLQKGTNTPTR